MPDQGLAGRVREAAAVLLPDQTEQDTGRLLDALVRDAQATRELDRLWLLMACLSTALPEAEQLRTTARVLRRTDPARAAVHLLDEALPDAVLTGGARLRVVTGGVLVLVDHSARHDLQTGIQRVVRAVLPRWARDHEVLPVAHSPEYAAIRTLAPEELERVLDWRPERAAREQEESTSALDPRAWEIVIPWRSTVVLAEVPHVRACPRFAALAQSSGNAVTAIGYDCIPVVSSGIVSPGQAEKFTAYLTVVKHAHHVAAISESAAAEFAGFVDMLPSQGLTGPLVTSCVLPSDMGSALIDTDPAQVTAPDLPVVLCVGRLDARKNQVALLHAAEQLWREGLEFRLVLVAGGGFGREGKRAVRRLQLRRRPVTLAQAISDNDLRAAYAIARFTVFASLHEGYGLPVAESFAMGVPVLTTSYGSTREIAAGGGALLVDPRDDDALREALRRMLTDDVLLARLRAEIAARPRRSWDDYAEQAWAVLVPERRLATDVR